MSEDLEHMRVLLERVVKRITNPSMTHNAKVRYAGDSLKCMILVANKWQIGVEEVLNIVERLEEGDVPFFLDDDEYKDLNDDNKIFWDFITEMEPFDQA